MELSSQSVLITGGATGIGFAMAERFARAGSDVVICGRREAALRDAQHRCPAIRTRVCDLATASSRQALFDWAVSERPRLNVLVNNAGIQRYVRLTEQEPWERTHEEVAINFEAPVHLSRLFVPWLLEQNAPVIINITSGLGFSPLARAPIYSATKAAMHSFTLSLRHQLAGTPIRVIEIVPPAVDTDLGGPGLHTFGVPVDELADAIMTGLHEGATEVAYGFADQARRASRAELDGMFSRMNEPTRAAE
jgi:uncharacterized oxidoreductase